jgi:hypothetical protein
VQPAVARMMKHYICAMNWNVDFHSAKGILFPRAPRACRRRVARAVWMLQCRERSACASAPMHQQKGSMGKKRRKMQATVEKVIKSGIPSEPDKAQISIPEGEALYREIRVENVVTDAEGEEAHLKPGAKVDLIVEADSSATIKKDDS